MKQERIKCIKLIRRWTYKDIPRLAYTSELSTFCCANCEKDWLNHNNYCLYYIPVRNFRVKFVWYKILISPLPRDCGRDSLASNHWFQQAIYQRSSATLCAAMQRSGARVTIEFSIAIQIQWKNSFRFRFNSNEEIATKFCKWHDNCAVVAYAKICCDLRDNSLSSARWNFHQIWKAGKNR